ncbi:hypothetical protein [Tamlana crocina]|uniref:Uncharacterized protein n=1 Tax=Tamlana crocina TaxID=393006 RepID=A0ABX1DEI3_9FLAO|nr:hypothetical protein [Tamlana crocina]NJX16748.1 hypothetical protein [Tamlana crocina]
MELSKELLESIDELLKKLFKDGTVAIHSYGTSSNDVLKGKSKELCKALNLIRIKSNSQYELDEKGIIVIQDGGIENYLNNLRLDKDLERTIKDLTKDNLEKQFKHNLIFVCLGGIIGLLTAAITMAVQPDSAKQYINKLNEMVEQDKLISKDLQTDIQQMRSEITFLEKQIDSLKYASNLNN